MALPVDTDVANVTLSLANTLCYKFGYGTDMERFKKEGRAKFSLLEDGTLDKPCCDHLLLVNVSFTHSSFTSRKRLTKETHRVPKTKFSQSTITTSASSTATRKKRGKSSHFSPYPFTQTLSNERIVADHIRVFFSFVKDTKHMGEPASFFIILKWIYKLLDIKSNPGEQMKCMITKPKAEYLE